MSTTQEARARAEARKQGLALVKSRSRTLEHYLWGTYMLVDPTTNTVVASGSQSGYGLTLDEIEDALIWEAVASGE